MGPYKRKNVFWTIGLVLLLAVFSFLVDWHASPLEQDSQGLNVPGWVPLSSFWNEFDYHLGLDLKGGTHLVYQTDTSDIDSRDRESAVEGVRDVIERRVNAFGVSEPVVQTNEVDGEYRIIVELAGVSDVNQAITMIGETPLLEFKQQNPEYSEQIELTPEQQQEMDEYNKQVELKAIDINNRALAGEDFDVLAREFSEDPGSKDKGGDLGWTSRGVFVPEFDRVLFEDLDVGQITPAPIKTQFGYHIIKKIDERQAVDTVDFEDLNDLEIGEDNNKSEVLENAIDNQEPNMEVWSKHILIATKSEVDFAPIVDQWENTALSGKHLERAYVEYDQTTGDPEVSLEFNDEGAELFEQITADNIGKPVAIFLDQYPISVPNVREKITGGRAVITGRFNLTEAKELVQRLNAGALPVPIEIISQQTVGPTLGKVSVNKSIFAGLIGLAAVALFMILYYRLPGLLSVLALSIYTVVVLMVFKLLPVTLTLAGVAGFILSIGMAVDANVLIFERLKEELRSGREFSGAVEEGFKRAWTSIRDSNISTLLTCAILIWFGSSIIKGFAITLAIGVLISMFSAIIITRSFLRVLNADKVNKHRWLVGRSLKH